MFSVDLSTREWDGRVVVALDGELDLVDAADVEAALVTVAAREPEIIVDLAALAFIDSSGVAGLARGRTHARQGCSASQSTARNMARHDPATVVLFPGCGDDS